MVKFDTLALDILGGSASFLTELATTIEIGETFANQVHLLDPILIKIEILIQTQVGHSPSGGATSLAFLAGLDQGNTSSNICFLTGLKEVSMRSCILQNQSRPQ
jgi:hypothetical protein